MKLWLLVNSVPSIREIVMKCALPVQKAFALSLFVKEVDDHIRTYDELRIKKVRELWEEKNGGKVVKEENKEEFQRYLEELHDQEVDIAAPQLSISDLGDVKIEARHLIQLDWLINK